MRTNFTRDELNYTDGQVYSIKTGKTLAVLPYFNENDKEQEANGKLFSASVFMFEKHEENIDLCDELLYLIVNDKKSEAIKKLSAIKLNCISGAWDGI